MTPIADGSETLGVLSDQLADAVERIGPAVVQVDGRPRRPSSGVVYAPELVLAADHAVEREERVSVEAAGGPARAAEVVGRDPASDLALLRVPGLAAEPARAATAPARVGQFVLAVARPAHRELMATIGIVSTVGGPLRTRGGLVEQYLCTDATPYPGFSGGALVDARGAVLGILTTGLLGGVAVAVPAALAWRLADTLAREGHVPRGWLGVGTQPVRLPPAQRAGRPQEAALLVVEIVRDSPAERGGLLLGDLLVSLDGRPLAEAAELQALLAGQRAGRTVTVEVVRGGALVTLAVTLGERPRRAR
jgi:S1-C subfamily serine protease